MMGGVFPTQVPGLLCGFYSKITIPETNLIWSAHGHFTRRAAGRTDVGEYQSELSKHGCREEKKIKMLWWCMRAYTAADSRGWGQCWRCSCVVQHQPYKLDVSMVQSRCFKSRSMWIAAAGRYRFQMVKAAACVWGERVSSITDTVCAQERKKKNNIYPIILSILKQMGNAASTCEWNRSLTTTTTPAAAAKLQRSGFCEIPTTNTSRAGRNACHPKNEPYCF